jgi:hypothetical protein
MPKLRINIPDRNTFVTTQSTGLIELKFISADDTRRFVKILRSEHTAREITIEILYSQILKPMLTIEEFNNIPNDDMVKILKAFVTTETASFQHFNVAHEPFSAFVEAIVEGQADYAKQIAEILTPSYESIATSMATIAKQFQSVTITPSMKSIVDNAIGQTDITKMIDVSQFGVSKHLQDHMSAFTVPKSILDAQVATIRSLTEIIAPDIKLWQEWTKRNTDIFSSTSKILKEFQEKYQIAESDAIEILAKYKWFVSPTVPVTLIYKVSELSKLNGNQSRAVNKLFIEYFEHENWNILDVLLEEWLDNDLFNSRRKIIADTFKVIQICNASNINVVNVVLPTLVVQIDGILKDFIKENIQPDINDHTKIKTLKDSGLIQSLSSLDEIGMIVFLDILFQSSNAGTPLKNPFNLNRHKILHAEVTKYGRKDYLVRVLMVLDILAHLKKTDE